LSQWQAPGKEEKLRAYVLTCALSALPLESSRGCITYEDLHLDGCLDMDRKRVGGTVERRKMMDW
jgi:hypothetical protein